MRKTFLAALALPLALAACEVTPLMQCQAPYRTELRTVRAEISETELVLRRGFRLVPARWELGLHYCVRPSGSVFLCTADDGLPMFDKRPISRTAERAKLQALLQEQARLYAALDACALQYPE